ncbi:hypothetical protein EOM60_04975 [Candidatus Saccharibacteria bacterium]|nr:hypothetical protein [Candidatus Saccharibacteria bacterium]
MEIDNLYGSETIDYGSVGTEDIGTGLGVVASLLLFFVYMLFILAFYVVYAIFLGKIFKKAGVDSYKAWIPIYNTWKTLEIGGQQGFWAILGLLPVINIVTAVLTYLAMHNINKKLGYEVSMTVLAILLPFVWVIVVGLSKNEWNDSLGDPRTDTPDVTVASSQPSKDQPAPPVSPKPKS